MIDYKINATFNTPLVELNRNGLLYIKGRSIPENSINFYQPIFNWIEEYGKRPAATTTLNVNLEFFNTSSSKCILDMFKGLEKIKKQGFEVIINWYYNDENVDMLESGKEYGSFLNLEFSLIKEK